MKKVYIRHKISVGEVHNISDKESTVLRSSNDLQIEDPIKAIAPNGVFVAQLVHIGKGSLEIEILKKTGEGEDVCSITLLQSLIKEDRIKFCFEKSVEIGINEIIPVFTQLADRSFENGNKSYKKWIRYVKDAESQSLRQHRTSLRSLVELGKLDLSGYTNYIKLCFTTENTDTMGLSSYLQGRNFQNKNFLIAVGPEKGWAQHDLDFFSKNKFQFITLGDTILRSETVAPVVAGVIKFYSNKL